MRNILEDEIKKERCNAAALGAYNASVGSSPDEYSAFRKRGLIPGNFMEIGGIEHRIIEYKIDSHGERSIKLDDGRTTAEYWISDRVGYKNSKVKKETKSEKYTVKESDFSDFQKKLANQYSSSELQKKINEYEQKRQKSSLRYFNEANKNKSTSNRSTQRFANAMNSNDGDRQWVKDYSNALEFKNKFLK